MPSLLYLVTEDWYFMSHRLPMACAAKRSGYDVHVATRVDKYGSRIEALGFQLHPLRWRRGSLNPIRVVRTAIEVRKLYQSIGPDLVHHVAAESAIIGSLASIGLKVTVLNAMTGLGAFTSRSARALLLRKILPTLSRHMFAKVSAAVLVQNPDDAAMMKELGINPGRLFLICGSGVDVDAFQVLPEPQAPITVGYAGRLLGSKGVRTLVTAQRLLAERGVPVRLLLAGDADPANGDSIQACEIDQWKRQDGVRLLGKVADIRELWAQAHIAALVSRREGIPKCLLEAAACGRPIVASNAPGCREVARANTNALLVPPDDPEALASSIDRLARDRELRKKFGQAGRDLVVAEFSSQRIGNETVALYDRLLGRAGDSHRYSHVLSFR